MTTKTDLLVEFAFRNETENAVRFAEVTPDDQPPVSGSFYLKKYAWASLGKPQTIVAVISAQEG